MPLIALVEKETKKSLTETDNFQIVHQAIRALGEIKDIKAIKPIVSQIPNKEISQYLISEALKQISDSSSKKLVTKILHHNDVEVIERAKYIIARLEK